MKRFVLVSLLAAVVVLSAAAPAFAKDNDPAPGATCGEFFGQHVAEHAKTGHIGLEHNPGLHEGLAGFADHGEEMICP